MHSNSHIMQELFLQFARVLGVRGYPHTTPLLAAPSKLLCVAEMLNPCNAVPFFA